VRIAGVARARWTLAPFAVSVAALRGVVPVRGLPSLAWRFGRVQRFVPCPHSIGELATVARAVAERAGLEGAVIECGSFKGGSTARLSLVCDRVGRELVVFDSFEGLPEPEPWDAEHAIGRHRVFERGEYAGSLDEVRTNVAAHGAVGVCRFVPGWFAETMPSSVPERVVVALVDADLVTSTRDALQALWPRLVPGGIVFVHDTADPKLTAYLADWSEEAQPAGSSGLPAPFAWFVKGAA
jgi:hypothetical protein